MPKDQPTGEESAKRYPHALAVRVATELGDLLRDCCETFPGDDKPRLRIVGSVRRLKPTVKDLELLYVARVVRVPDAGTLFGETLDASAVNVRLDELVASGVLAKRPKADGTLTWGENIRLAVHVATGLPCDFFAATRENWWNQLVCRTGGKDTNTAICNGAIARGLKWATTSAGFECRRSGRLLVRVNSEQDVFAAARMDYLEPKDRK